MGEWLLQREFLGDFERRDRGGASSQGGSDPGGGEILWRVMAIHDACDATRSFLRFALLPLWLSLPLCAQRQYYVGALTGVSTLSADGRFSVTSSEAAGSSYKPRNGPIANAFAGVHVNDYLSAQANYTGSWNSLVLTSIQGPNSAYEQERRSSQHSFSGDLAVYFRSRRSWVRPFLAVGAGVARLESDGARPALVRGTPSLPPERFSSSAIVFRSAVGIDVAMARGWAFRFSFVEPIRRNPISRQLTPPGERNLASFQNLFGFVKTFGRVR